MLFVGKLVRNKFLKVIFAFWVAGFFILWGALLPFSATCLSKSALQLAYAQDYAKPFVFGPYIPLSPGKYQVTFTLKVEDNKTTQPLARLEVTAKKAQRVFAYRTVGGADFKFPGRYQGFDLQFETIAGEKDFEFRISYYGNSKLWVEKIGIAQLQGYSEQEAIGTDLIRGYSKNKIIPETESFLKGSKQEEMRIDDKKLSRRIGYLVSDPQAPTGRAWLVKPSMIQAVEQPPASVSSATSPKPKIFEVIKLPKIQLPKMRAISTRGWKPGTPWLMFLIGLVSGYVLALTSLVFWRRVAVSALKRVGTRLRSYTLSDIKIFIFRAARCSALIALAFGTLASVYYRDLTLIGLPVRGEYLLLLYAILSVLWKIDLRASIVPALVLLASSSLLLTLGQDELAERAAIYIYYLLILGTVFRLLEYVKDGRRVPARTLTGLHLAPDVVLPVEASVAEYGSHGSVRPRREHPRSTKIKWLLIAVTAVFFLIMVVAWAVAFRPDSGNLKTSKHLRVPKNAAKSSSRAEVLGEEVGEKETVVARPETEPAGRNEIKMEILNGNGIAGEAARIGSLLKRRGYSVLGVGNSDRFDYSNTIIQYKSGQRDKAEQVAEEIGSIFATLFSEDLPSSHQADIVVVLGNNKIDNSGVRVHVLNGNGLRGEASRVANQLKPYGFKILNSKDADRDDYSHTIIRHKPAQRDIARLVASEISESYPALLEESLPSDSSADIVVILGRDKIDKS